MGYLYIALGATLGAWTRHLLQITFATVVPTLPAGTFLANFFGAVAIGAIAPFLSFWSPETRLLVVTGFLGALTTLSSFVLEVVEIGGNGKPLVAAGYWFAGAVVCLGACWVSYRLTANWVAG